MSLNVSLYSKPGEECACPTCGSAYTPKEQTCLYDSNITHNLGKMAGEAGIYMHLWRPEEIGITRAGDLIQPLEKGLADLKGNPSHYERFNSPNGWGMYEHFVPFVESYLEACKKFPDAVVEASR